jgi:hypothetical protein
MNAGPAKASVAFLFALLLLLSACATTQKLSDDDRRKIDVVRINSNVQVAPAMYYLGPGTGILFALGPVGAGVAAASSLGSGKEIQAFAEKNGIFIEKLALQEIDVALRRAGKLKVSDPGEAAGTVMNVFVYQYGFSIPNGFSSKLVPVLAIKCEMVDATGKIIWSASESSSLLRSPATPMTLEAMREDPKRIEAAWRTALKVAAENIARAL